MAQVENRDQLEMEPKVQLRNKLHMVAISKLQQQQPPTVRPTLRRFFILFLFVFNTGNKAFQWYQLSASTKKVAYFYEVENYVINGTSVIFLVSYILLALPACYLVDMLGLRKSLLISSLGMSVGSIIKCFSCHEDGIASLYIGLFIASLCSQLVLAASTRVASIWFPDKEVSSAMAMNVLGYHVGQSLGFLLPQYALDGVESKEGIGANLLLIYQVNALVSVLGLIGTYLFFSEAPKHPPGLARLRQLQQKKLTLDKQAPGFLEQMGVLMTGICEVLKKRNFQLLLLSYAINEGLQDMIVTILNQLLSSIWPGEDMLIGYTGFIYIMSGVMISPVVGAVLDKWHKYKLTNIALTLGVFMSSLFFGLVFEYYPRPWLVYLVASLFGVCGTGVMISGPELAVELTYPVNELITSTLMNMSPSIFGIFCIFEASHLIDTLGHTASIAFLLIMILISLVLLFCSKETLNRQTAAKERTMEGAKQEEPSHPYASDRRASTLSRRASTWRC